MLDIAWPELMVIGVVALVAIGPKDLPKVMHAMGKWAAKARNFTHDIRRALEQVSYETDIADRARKNLPEEVAPQETSSPTMRPLPPHPPEN